MKKHIPNILTLLNLFCGVIATILAVQGHLIFAAYFMFAGIFFDFFDGLAARLLKVQSELGLQLDSLADVVTSGVVPGIVMFQLFNMSSSNYSWAAPEMESGFNFSALSLFGIIITLGAAYRLAKFNIDEDQSDSFIGLPTPANALLILSLPLILEFQENAFLSNLILNKWFLIIVTIISTYMMNARITLFALKFKTWGFKENSIRYVFLVLSAILIGLLKYAAIPVIIFLYVLFSIVVSYQKKSKPAA
ncbi:CDP-alcohol phosphatidyltransferase family protein [Galbibacter mesophilus]|uniref:CDP-alcohol phosphatidyltransferase family protein n=1 Tax=Galbibacter mesophilus TaxID=379069 RepID=UPI00191ED66C|nr:CDP-alcohol phosphatidyltransferase family protein [Galbibacter mesophilus]MCM5663729.1 CDP-alcohol phosphatidyltransferase family protein [Galbibacter mesophilus]